MFDFRKILPQFDRFLCERTLRFEAVIIGGAAMQLLGLTSRVTKDCDVLIPTIPQELAEAAREFARTHELRSEWLNNGPESLIRDLPEGWQDLTVELYRGNNLILHTLGRLDLIRSKLFAFVDRGIDLEDLLQIKPSYEELERVAKWLKERDANPDWPTYVEIRLKELREKLYDKHD